MKQTLITLSLLLITLWLASCSNDSNGPLTEAEQAAKYNLTVEEYKEMKDAAARMNMTIEEHMKHTNTNWEHDMNMSDDSHMIEE